MNDPFQLRPGDPILPIRHRRGLGDLVAMIAQPIARAIDTMAGTDLQNCKGCADRKDRLNEAAPFKLPIASRRPPATPSPAPGDDPAR